MVLLKILTRRDNYCLEFVVFFVFTFIVKSIYPVDGRALVVSSEQKEVLWILDFVCKQQANCLQRLFSSVDVVAQEEVIALWWESTVLEQSQQVVILSVNVTCNLQTPFLILVFLMFLFCFVK